MTTQNTPEDQADALETALADADPADAPEIAEQLASHLSEQLDGTSSSSAADDHSQGDPN